LPESAIGTPFCCPHCQQTIQLVSGEALAEGAGTGDFDAWLTVAAGPGLVGTRLLLGGVADVLIGKRPDCQIVLPAPLCVDSGSFLFISDTT